MASLSVAALPTLPAAPPRPFACVWHNDGGVAWMRLEGELDVASAPELTHELCQAQSGALLVVLDLRDLAFMDSAGVHVVVDATATARRHGRRLVLVRAPALVHAVFERTQTTGDVEVVHLEAGEPAVQVLPSLEQRRLAS